MRIARRLTLASVGAAWVAWPQRRVVAAEPQPIRVGLLLAMTGPLAGTSEEIAYGVALALDQADRMAGGRRLHVTVEDTQGRRARAVERFAKLVQEDRVDVVIGPTGSPEALALRDAAHEAGVPLIVPNAGASALTAEKCSPFLLRVSYAHEQIAGPLGAWMARDGRARSAYLLAADNAAGRDTAAAFRKHFQAAGGVVAGEELVPAEVSDLAPYLGRIKLLKTDAIFASFFGAAAERFVLGAEAFGLRLAALRTRLADIDARSRAYRRARRRDHRRGGLSARTRHSVEPGLRRGLHRPPYAAPQRVRGAGIRCRAAVARGDRRARRQGRQSARAGNDAGADQLQRRAR